MDDQTVDREGGRSVRRRQFIRRSFVFALLASSSTTIGACTSGAPPGSIDETKRRGNIVIQALVEYHADHSNFPNQIDELVPKYLDEIPRPDWGLRAWTYEPTGTGFILGVNENEHTGDGESLWLRYFGKNSGWQMGD
jgi:hypothetical protein